MGVGLSRSGPPGGIRAAELARPLGHPFNLFVSLSVGTVGLTVCGGHASGAPMAGEAKIIAEEHGISFMGQVMVPFWDGYALIAQGEHDEGYAALTVGSKGWRDTGPLHLVPLANITRARALTGLERFRRSAAPAGRSSRHHRSHGAPLARAGGLQDAG